MKTRGFAVSIHADDEFNLRLSLMSELDDVTPRDGLADLVIARYRRGRRRRFAGVFGLFVVFAGIGVPIGVASASGGAPARSGPVVLRLGSYTLALPDRYHLTDVNAAPCAAGAAAATRPAGEEHGTAVAAASSGVCILMILAPLADPNVPRDAKPLTVGPYRAWLAPRGYSPAGDGTALIIKGDGRDLVIGASGLPRSALVSLVSAGLSAA
jgi:hypothetical protein